MFVYLKENNDKIFIIKCYFKNVVCVSFFGLLNN